MQYGRRSIFLQIFLLSLVTLVVIPSSQIATAAPQSGNPASDPSKPPPAYMKLDMMTPDEGVDFGQYLASVYKAVRVKWSLLMPASVEKGEQGIVIVRFHIQQDGKVPAETLTFESPRSGKPPLDVSAEYAIRRAAPFDGLPAKFTEPYIDVRIAFFYNIAQTKNP